MRVSPVVAIVIGAHLGALGCSSVDFERERRYADPPADSYRVTSLAINVDGAGDTVVAAHVTKPFFEVPQAVPLLGRTFTPDEYRTAGGGVAMISESYWKTRLGGSPEIIGWQITIEGQPRTIVGVGPPGFAPQNTRIWLPALQ
jgi:hypothetical protein